MMMSSEHRPPTPTFSLEIETAPYPRRRPRLPPADPRPPCCEISTVSMTTLPAGFILTERQQQSASSSVTSTHQQLTVQTADRWRGSQVTPLWGLFNRAEETASGNNTEANLGRARGTYLLSCRPSLFFTSPVWGCLVRQHHVSKMADELLETEVRGRGLLPSICLVMLKEDAADVMTSDPACEPDAPHKIKQNGGAVVILRSPMSLCFSLIPRMVGVWTDIP